MALTRITSPRKLRRFISYDLEWVPADDIPSGPAMDVKTRKMISHERSEPLKLRMCGVYDGLEAPAEDPEVRAGAGSGPPNSKAGRYRCYDTIAAFLETELTSKNRGAWFYAHAGGAHDVEFVFDEIIKQVNLAQVPGGPKAKSWKVRASFSGASAIIVHVTRGKSSWHFCDSYWLLRDALANIGRAIGLPKLDEEKRTTKAETVSYYRNTPIEKLRPYNVRDCEILWHAIDKFQNTVLATGGQLQMTIASTALQLFRRAMLKADIETSDAVNEAARRAYFASRVEVFNTRAEDFLIYDINSSFPHAMTFPAPGNLLGARRTIPEREEALYLADVLIEVPEMYLPPIPHRIGGRVFFPTGIWRSWLSNVDIQLLLREGGRILKVYEAMEFEPMHELRDYAEKVYAARRESKTDYEKLVYKYLLNSLYGKFAESSWKAGVLINPAKIDRRIMKQLVPGVWQQEKQVPVGHVHVPLSVHITAIARRTLYDYLKECERQAEEYHYVDSVTGDRTVVLRSPDGSVVIEPIEEVWEKRGADLASYRGRKETARLPGWSALARDSSGKTGWFPLKRMIRHKTGKRTYLISSKRGQVRVTKDHSLVVRGEEIKPADFIRRNMQFETLPAMPGKALGILDLLDYVKDLRRHFATDAAHGGTIENQIVADEADDAWLTYRNFRKPKSRVKRRYKAGTRELHALLRVLAAYISEGSASLRGITTKTRDMLSICQNWKGWLLDLKHDFSQIAKGFKFTGPSWSEGSRVYYLRSGAGFLPFLFTSLAGAKSSGKRLPSFIYDLGKKDFLVFWRKLMEGDGWVNAEGRDGYTTSSQRLAAGLSYALGQHGFEHSIHYRKDKKSYLIRTRPDGKERERWTTLVEKGRSTGFVYDLEVEGAHTFVDGLGRVLLHNTDSVATAAKLPTDDKQLGALKLEKKITSARFAAPKVYMGEGFVLKKDGTWEPVQMAKAKGFSLPKDRKEASEKLKWIIEGHEVEVQRMARLREIYRTGTTEPVEILVKKALTGLMLSKRHHYPDGSTRPWTIEELYSGDANPMFSKIDVFDEGKILNLQKLEKLALVEWQSSKAT